jgi:hypothetical protein
VACFAVLRTTQRTESEATGEQKPPRLPAGGTVHGSRGHANTLLAAKGGPQRRTLRLATRRSGGPPVASRHSRRRLTWWLGGRWFPGTPVAEHLARKGTTGGQTASPGAPLSQHWRDGAAGSGRANLRSAGRSRVPCIRMAVLGVVIVAAPAQPALIARTSLARSSTGIMGSWPLLLTGRRRR